MGSRTVPFDSEAICDECGEKGAYDFMGDYLCPECYPKYIEEAPASKKIEEILEEYICDYIDIKEAKAQIYEAIADEVEGGDILSDIVVEAIYRWGAPVHAGYPARIAEQVAEQFAAHFRAKGAGG